MIDAPNQSSPGNRKANSNGPLAAGAGSVNPPNSPDNRKSGTMPLGGGASPVNPPNNGAAVFKVGSSRMAQPPSAIEPGKGAIPVAPFTTAGTPAQATPMKPPALRK